MKLIKCYVYSFGKLKDFEYDFNQNLNTINQENGWGKSTFTAFIKAMFYGLNDKKRSVAENERVKYKPWNSTEKFGGYVIFDWKDKQFKIERFFGSKESEDTVVLTDTRTGKTFADTKDLGKRIFQIDEEGFLSANKFSGKDGMEISVFGNEERILLVSRFDNLGKGASGAAIQNMNVLLGLPETTGLIL